VPNTSKLPITGVAFGETV